MKRIISIITALFLVTSCALHAPEFRGGEGVEFDTIAGKQIKFNAKAKVYNGNWFGVKVKPSKVDLYIDGKHSGTLQLEKKVKMKARRETLLQIPMTAELSDSPLLLVARYAGEDKVRVQLKGKVKGGVFILSKKIDINESVDINPRSLSPL